MAPVLTGRNVFGDEVTTATPPRCVSTIIEDGKGRERTTSSPDRTAGSGNSVFQTVKAIAAKAPTTASRRLHCRTWRRHRTARRVPSSSTRPKSAGTASASTSSSRLWCSYSGFIVQLPENAGLQFPPDAHQLRFDGLLSRADAQGD